MDRLRSAGDLIRPADILIQHLRGGSRQAGEPGVPICQEQAKVEVTGRFWQALARTRRGIVGDPFPPSYQTVREDAATLLGKGPGRPNNQPCP